jgi:glycosyltransferase involved in cell wall biosynthesis
MACGTPVITTDGGALPEVVGNAGVIVPAGNTEALAAAIADLLANKPARDRLSDLGLLRVEANFSWHAAATAMSHYYRQSVLAAYAHH